ncbi:MAG: carboxypeptidase-like regulatory domain-containing protein, partial [Acidobacteria bacterium]|nr:carboxypeptidase-like regulatory domain-containing protein [Acidobacteriota bacterium]
NCGALSNILATLTVLNSTISGNTTMSGGNFCNRSGGAVTLRNVTITNNTGTGAGGIEQGSNGTLNFGNTIVAGNNETVGSGSDEIVYNGGTITSAGGNLVGDEPGDSTSIGLLDIAYQPSDKQNVNPLLGPLQNNGGPTPTHALFVGSPAVDGGLNALANNAGLSTDQRGTGFPRFVDGDGNGLAFVDIGAFEVQLAPTAATVSVSGRVLNITGRGVSNAVVHLTNQNGETQTARTNSFGYYSFKDIPAGETYVINVYSKRYQFTTQVITVTEDLDELNFTTQ